MNERIRELKRQATDFYLRDETLDCSIAELHELVEQKFAELIVRECIDVVLDKDGKEWAGYVHVCREESAGMIKKHFGVE